MTQLNLADFADNRDDVSKLTDAEREVYVTFEQGDSAVRDLARERDRRPGTVGNLLKRARLRLDGRDQEVSSTW